MVSRRVNDVIEDAQQIAWLQIAKVDEVVSDAVDRMQATTEVIQQGVLAPFASSQPWLREFQWFTVPLFKTKNHVDEVHQDEELFI